MLNQITSLLKRINFMKKLSGVKYPIKNRMIDSIATPSLYISNEMNGDRLEAVFGGDLLVVESRD